MADGDRLNQSESQPSSGVTPAKPMVAVKDLHFTRGDRLIFDGVDINIERGKITAIIKLSPFSIMLPNV